MVLFELVGCGFNAHSQLQSSIAELEKEVYNVSDISTPQVLAIGESTKPVYIGWSDLLYSIVERDGGIYWYGAQGSGRLDDSTADLWKQGDVKLVGDHSGPICAIFKSRSVFLWIADDSKPRFVHEPRLGNEISHIAIAGNGRVCVVKARNRIFAYRDFKVFLTSEAHERIWSIPTDNVSQLVANESSFALLTTEGEVYTWGDPRYSLGRDITEEEPATEPSIVPALEGLCIAKISSGGWLAGALSEDRDLYIWGHTGNDGAVLEFIPDSPGDVGLVDLGESVDILDIAIGSGHVCVLTEGGDVYTAGRNENGQTGIPSEASYQSKWLKWERDWQGDVKSIFSGPFSWNTLVLVERNI